MNFNKFLQILIILSLFLFVPAATSAAVLYLEPASGEHQPGETFIVDLKIDTEGECINAIEGHLNFSQDILKAVDFSQADSLLILWLKLPEINQSEGLISFIGGIPGGYCGRIPGDPGPSDLIGKLILNIPGTLVQEKEKNIGEIKFLDSSRVLLNDGLGTETKITVQGAVFSILEKPGTPENEWLEIIKEDKIPPELFEIEFNQDPLIFEGKYFITFFTADKQTGIDYYEIKEGEGDWKSGESPYLLEDQQLQSIIKVKAVDKAGNERITEYIPETLKKPLYFWWIVLILLGTGVIVWIIYKTIKKK